MISGEPTLRRILYVLNTTLGANLERSDLEGVRRLDEVVAFDSIALLELAVGLEKEFGIRIESESLARDFVVDLDRLVEYLEKRGTPPAPPRNAL